MALLGRKTAQPLRQHGGFFAALSRQAEAADYEKWVKATFLSYAPAVLQRYPISAGNDIRFLAGEVFGASYFYSPARTVARTASSKVAKTWMFQFTRVNPHAPFAKFGALHTREIGYVLGNPGAGLGTAVIKIEPKDREIADVMSSTWVRFAATGDPNSPGLPSLGTARIPNSTWNLATQSELGAAYSELTSISGRRYGRAFASPEDKCGKNKVPQALRDD